MVKRRRLIKAKLHGWCVVTTQVGRERWAAENIINQGAEVYLPMMEEWKKGEVRAECVFPGYVFVRTQGPWRFLLGTFGVKSLLMAGDKPAVLLDREVAKLRVREFEGLVRLPKPDQTGLRKGSAVRIVGNNAAAGYRGIYEGMGPQNRRKVLLDVMGKKVPMLVQEDQFEVVP